VAQEPYEGLSFVAGASESIGDWIVRELTARQWTIAVAESLTGGLLVAELIRTPGASAVVSGGIVAYSTELKHTLLGVNSGLLAAHGPVHADVAAQMAAGVRDRLAVAGIPATVGLSTTGVAGPDTQDGVAVGTVFLGFAIGGDVHAVGIQFTGDREAIRRAAVSESLVQLKAWLVRAGEDDGE
jgi:nicotinamide-nucleotide amidase